MNAREVASQYKMTQWAEILKECRASGEGVKQFCERRGIKRAQYFYWQRKIRQTVCEHFEEEQGEKTTSLSVARFTQVSLEATPRQATLPSASETMGGLRIQVDGIEISAEGSYPPEKLVELLRGLRQC